MRSSENMIAEVLRFVFNADFFKGAIFKKVKSPPEIVVGTAILSGRHHTPYEFGLSRMADATKNMGQAPRVSSHSGRIPAAQSAWN